MQNNLNLQLTHLISAGVQGISCPHSSTAHTSSYENPEPISHSNQKDPFSKNLALFQLKL